MTCQDSGNHWGQGSPDVAIGPLGNGLQRVCADLHLAEGRPDSRLRGNGCASKSAAQQMKLALFSTFLHHWLYGTVCVGIVRVRAKTPGFGTSSQELWVFTGMPA